jgi:hypothetical protein
MYQLHWLAIFVTQTRAPVAPCAFRGCKEYQKTPAAAARASQHAY